LGAKVVNLYKSDKICEADLVANKANLAINETRDANLKENKS